jgi:RND superfamily putative drug exporter
MSLATAVFLDAFVVRCLLVPAVLELLGRRTWLFPAWLDKRLPRLAIEPGASDVTPASDRVPAPHPALEGVS